MNSKFIKFDYQISINELANHFKKYFPQRSKTFFINSIKIALKTSGVYIFLHKNKVSGAVFFFKIDGYPEEVWSPSYLFVDKEARSQSLFVLDQVFKKNFKNFIDPSPTKDVKKVLNLYKYNEMSSGSILTPLFFRPFLRKAKFKKIFLKASIPKKFANKYHNNIIWFSYYLNKTEYHICLKRIYRKGFYFFVVVFCEKDHLNDLLFSLVYKLFYKYPFYVLLSPNFINKEKLNISFEIDKFHVFKNFYSRNENIYSLLGSELTELF